MLPFTPIDIPSSQRPIICPPSNLLKMRRIDNPKGLTMKPLKTSKSWLKLRLFVTLTNTQQKAGALYRARHDSKPEMDTELQPRLLTCSRPTTLLLKNYSIGWQKEPRKIYLYLYQHFNNTRHWMRNLLRKNTARVNNVDVITGGQTKWMFVGLEPTIGGAEVTLRLHFDTLVGELGPAKLNQGIDETQRCRTEGKLKDLVTEERLKEGLEKCQD